MVPGTPLHVEVILGAPLLAAQEDGVEQLEVGLHEALFRGIRLACSMNSHVVHVCTPNAGATWC